MARMAVVHGFRVLTTPGSLQSQQQTFRGHFSFLNYSPPGIAADPMTKEGLPIPILSATFANQSQW
jgi:hypothetical protein